ncbi:uncharacterized protein LOC114352597 [Ostrinia furnacalis]|uniref:uncharacterized protein LOC114352597 n=1 Tax=Ostrinia furnacalis TaxID=93504 RepID=UPI0010408CC5|nr:uncharacterized protein LOC114352597 [Ostrinia furnacalis]
MVSNPDEKPAEVNVQQAARAKLRENFLSALCELQGKSVSILTYEQSTLEATFSAWKPDGSELLVKDMMTPASYKVPSAILRTPDLIAIEFTEPVQLP